LDDEFLSDLGLDLDELGFVRVDLIHLDILKCDRFDLVSACEVKKPAVDAFEINVV